MSWRRWTCWIAILAVLMHAGLAARHVAMAALHDSATVAIGSPQSASEPTTQGNAQLAADLSFCGQPHGGSQPVPVHHDGDAPCQLCAVGAAAVALAPVLDALPAPNMVAAVLSFEDASEARASRHLRWPPNRGPPTLVETST